MGSSRVSRNSLVATAAAEPVTEALTARRKRARRTTALTITIAATTKAIAVAFAKRCGFGSCESVFATTRCFLIQPKCVQFICDFRSIVLSSSIGDRDFAISVIFDDCQTGGREVHRQRSNLRAPLQPTFVHRVEQVGCLRFGEAEDRDARELHARNDNWFLRRRRCAADVRQHHFRWDVRHFILFLTSRASLF